MIGIQMNVYPSCLEVLQKGLIRPVRQQHLSQSHLLKQRDDFVALLVEPEAMSLIFSYRVATLLNGL
jgi:hypothetical protein